MTFHEEYIESREFQSENYNKESLLLRIVRYTVDFCEVSIRFLYSLSRL